MPRPAAKALNKLLTADYRGLSRSSLTVRSNSARSSSESEPASDNSFWRRLSLSISLCRKLSMASASTVEIPFCPRRDATASRALRCSGFISTVVRMSSLCIHSGASQE